jgi:hypothetical protein
MKKLLILVLLSGNAHAQILWDQSGVPDISVAQHYAYKLYVTPPGLPTPATVISLVSVVCGTSASSTTTAACSAPIQQAASVGALAPGTKSELTAIDTANGFAESTKSAPFIMQGCTDPNNVKVNVGTWTRTIPMNGVGQVLYSLRASKTPVTLVIVAFNGIEQDRLQGVKLNNVAGSYFVANTPKGSYQLTVEAQDAAGCKDGGASRPMTVVVQ